MTKHATKTIRNFLRGWLCLSFFTVAVAQPAPAYQAASTKRMADLLLRIYEQQDWKTDPSKEAERAAFYRAGLKQSLDVTTTMDVPICTFRSRIATNRLSLKRKQFSLAAAAKHKAACRRRVVPRQKKGEW